MIFCFFNLLILRRRLISWCISRIDSHADWQHHLKNENNERLLFPFSSFFVLISYIVITWVGSFPRSFSWYRNFMRQANPNTYYADKSFHLQKRSRISAGIT